MDNLTHSLFGVAVAEAAYQTVRPKDKKQAKALRWVLYICSIIANNLPDIDILLSVFDTSSLGYLLNHRGHTHTLAMAWPQAIYLVAIVLYVAKRKGYNLSFYQSLVTGLVAVIGLHLHIGLDYLNTYGVHPFWPLDNHWYFGDVLFIMEPLLWCILIACCAETTKNKILHYSLLTVALVLCVLGVFVGLLQWLSIAGLVAFYIFLINSFRDKAPLKILRKSFVFVAVVVGMFWGSSYATKFQLLKITNKFRQAGGRVTDVVLTPLPVQPFCTVFQVVELRDGMYRVHMGVQRHEPFGIQVPCPNNLRVDKALPGLRRHPLAKYSKKDATSWRWLYEQPVKEVLDPARTNCKYRAWLQFSRLPAVWDNEYNDLRFAMKRRENFSRYVNTGADDECPPWKVPWIPPLSDLLKASL